MALAAGSGALGVVEACRHLPGDIEAYFSRREQAA